MTTLRKAVDEYLKMRRSLGFQLREAGVGLLDFVTFMQQRLVHHSAVGPQVGATTLYCSTGRMGEATQSRSNVRALSQRHRSADANSSRGPTAVSSETRPAILVYR